MKRNNKIKVAFLLVFSFFCLVVNKSVFVSKINYQYLKSPVNTHFLDSNFYNCIVDNYNNEHSALKEYTSVLTDTELNDIESISCSNKNITNINGIEKLKNIVTLDLSSNNINNIKNLINNTYDKLTNINISNNELDGELYWNKSMFPHLTNLNLADNKISDISIPNNVTQLLIYNNANDFSKICNDFAQLTTCDNNTIVISYYNNSTNPYYMENRKNSFKKPIDPLAPVGYTFVGWYYATNSIDDLNSTYSLFDFDDANLFSEMNNNNVKSIKLYAIFKATVTSYNSHCNINIGGSYICDVNGDSVINSGDAVTILKNVVNYDSVYKHFNSLQLSLMDANWNREVNTGDAVVILRFVLDGSRTLSTSSKKKVIPSFMENQDITDSIFALTGYLIDIDDSCYYGKDYASKCHKSSCIVSVSKNQMEYSKYDFDSDGDLDMCDIDALGIANGYGSLGITVDYSQLDDNYLEDQEADDDSDLVENVENPKTNDLSVFLILILLLCSVGTTCYIYNKEKNNKYNK